MIKLNEFNNNNWVKTETNNSIIYASKNNDLLNILIFTKNEEEFGFISNLPYTLYKAVLSQEQINEYIKNGITTFEKLCNAIRLSIIPAKLIKFVTGPSDTKIQLLQSQFNLN